MQFPYFWKAFSLHIDKSEVFPYTEHDLCVKRYFYKQTIAKANQIPLSEHNQTTKAMERKVL